MRRLLIASVILAILAGVGYAVYTQLTSGSPPPPDPEFTPSVTLANKDEFEKLASEDPVAMLAQCLSRYSHDVTHYHCTLEKQERVQGKPNHPDMPPVEVIDVWVRGEVPNPETKKTAIEVQMKWKSGAKKALGLAEIRATLFSEKTKSEGGFDGKVVTWPGLFGRDVTYSDAKAPNIPLAKGQSRYCIRDGGLYRSMLRTYEAWKSRQADGKLHAEYLGKKTHEKIGRECYVIKRTCQPAEIDSFELGGVASTDPAEIAKQGFTEVTIYIDVERRLQIGSELFRTESDGTRVLIGTYYQRDVELNPTIPPDVFTIEGLKK